MAADVEHGSIASFALPFSNVRLFRVQRQLYSNLGKEDQGKLPIELQNVTKKYSVMDLAIMAQR